MTDPTPRSEGLRTAAGVALASRLYGRLPGTDWDNIIGSIEDAAALAASDTAPDDGRLRTAVQGLIDALPYEPGSALGGKIALVIAALASPDPTGTPTG